MSGLFGALGTATRALFVTQQGLRTTSHNIANVNNPDYSRQRQVLGTTPPVSALGGTVGTGVEQVTIERLSDRFVQAALIRERASSAALDTQLGALRRIDELMNEQNREGLGAALSRFYDAFQDLASASTSGAPIERENLRAVAESLVTTVRQQDADLRQVQADAETQIKNLVDEINSLSSQIATLNADIAEQNHVAPANDLLDQRDALVRELSEKIDIQTFERENGAVVVQLPFGASLVDEFSARQLTVQGDPGNPFNPTFSRVFYDDGSNRFDLTAQIGGGELGGQLRVRDTLAAQSIRDLDTIAYNLMRTVNDQHQLGLGLDGGAHDFFTDLGQVEDAARSLALDADIVASTDAIAAGQTADPGDNRNALDLAGLRVTASAIFLPGDPPGPASGPTQSLLDYTGSVVNRIGQQTRGLEQASAQRGRVIEELEARRQEVSGVSLDEEVVALVQLQATFQANARVIATVQGLLDEVVSLL